MDRIAFIIEEQFLYWNAIILVLAAACAICLFLSLYLRRPGNGNAAALLVPMALILSLIFARAIHWYCRTDSYDSFASAMTDYSRGGFALMGVFFGTALAAALLKLTGVVRDLGEVLDCLSLGGAAGISLGRLACLFTSADRGDIIEGLTSLPWVYPTANAVTGETEYRLATFMLQAMVTGVIFLALVVFYLRGRGKPRSGDTALLFLLFYGSSQIVLDSTRYDSLFMRSNGFISLVQILGLIFLLIAVVAFSVRMVRARGFRGWMVGLWLPLLALLGVAAYMEYHVQRHGDQALFAYGVMSLCLILADTLTVAIRNVSKDAAQAL